MSVSTALLIAGAVIALAALVGIILRRQDGRRRSGGHLTVRPEDVADATLAARATLVQFSTKLCARCPQVRRMLTAIADANDGVAHVEIDLTHRNDLATRYHVLQTPTTFLVDASGAVQSRWGGLPDRREIEEALSTVPAVQKLEQI